MVKCRPVSAIFIAVAAFSSIIYAEVPQNKTQPEAHSGKNITYPASHGDVLFDHDRHADELKGESCAPCHHPHGPMGKECLARFDARVAHCFCKGCLRESGRGPTECHGCHKISGL